jgi:hypothetical protein
VKRFATASPTGSTPNEYPHSVFARLLLLASMLAITLVAVSPAAALGAPSATTEPATDVHHTSAVLNGRLNPEGDPGIVECRFEWGASVAYGNTAPCSEGNSFASPTNVTASIGNLTPGTTYHFRLHVETTSSGPFNGADRSFRPDTFPVTHPEIASFGPDGTAASSFSKLFSLAFDSNSSKLFALDKGASAIYGFDASASPDFTPLANFSPLTIPGPPEDQSDIAVDATALPSAGNVYYASESGPLGNNVYGYSATGTPLPGFPIATATGRGCGVAVDSAGRLWVANHQNSVEEFSSSGAALGVIATPNQFEVCKLGFDSNDDMYVANRTGDVWKYTKASGYNTSTLFASGSFNSVSVDQSTHHVYLSNYEFRKLPAGGRVEEYDAAGHLLGESAAGNESLSVVDSASHDIFVSYTQTGQVHVFGAEEITRKLPTVTTGDASAITGSTATISGAVDPEGFPVTECHIAWGTTNSYGNSAPCDVSPGSGSGNVQVSAEITGLTSGTSYDFRVFASNAEGTSAGSDASFTTNFPPAVSLASPTAVTNGSADLNGFVNPKGFATSYRFEWGPTRAYGNSVPIPDANAGSGEGNVAVSGHISGLAPNSRYHWRLVAESVNGTAVSRDADFFTLGAPLAETTGSPIRTMTSAQLGGRVSPRGFATSYYFEYGDQGPCDSNPCEQTAARSAGSGEFEELASEEVSGLQSGTTYHYRLVADNGQPGSPVFGGDMTVTTRSSEAPLSHGHFPGPVGSDRAWELVSAAESGGNPVEGATVISDDGSRAVWGLGGGSPLTDSGGFNELYSERTTSGWQTKYVYPPRSEQAGPNWHPPIGRSDLSSFAALNFTISGGYALFRVTPGMAPVKLYEWESEETWGKFEAASDDGSRVLVAANEDVDPQHPAPPHKDNLYDVTSPGDPHLVSLLPGGTVASCGISAASDNTSPYHVAGPVPRSSDWISPNGELAFFLSSGNDCGSQEQLYMRDFGAEETKLLSGPALSGPSCGAGFIRSTADTAFFWTKARLSADDTAPENCSDETSDGDVYRYDLGDGSLECVTCVVPNVEADVFVGGYQAMLRIAVAEDGSRLYFASASRLLPGAASEGYYRLDLENGDLAYLGQVGEGNVGLASIMTPDGSLLFFHSSDPSLDPLGGGAGNAGTQQLYRYDDDDRSLVCVSCPQDGSAPRGAASAPGEGIESANMGSLSKDGSVFAFNTPTPLVGADQNTAGLGQDPIRGQDVYEWRNGRLLLVSDGLKDWPGVDAAPSVRGMTPSGQDILFTAASQYTPDALDDFRRLYDARIGGGIEFPKPPPPCPLEVCQGTPKGTPEEAAPGTSSFSGPGNAKPSQKKRHHKKRHHKQTRTHAKHRANHNRRAAR